MTSYLMVETLVTIFFIILYIKPIVLYAPSDYKDDKSFTKLFDKDFEENKILTVTESVTKTVAESVPEIVKEDVQNTDNDSTTSNVITINEAKKTLKRLEELVSDKLEDYTYSYDNEYQRKRYNEEAIVFEDRIATILTYLDISYNRQPKDTCMDFIAKRKDGKSIPIEVKYYEAPLTGRKLTRKLAWQIQSCISTIGSDEFILIISSSISDDVTESIRKINSEIKIHIVTGDTRTELISQLKDVFGIV
jgi:hypothetical protein